MKAELIVHRKAPNRAVLMLLATAKVMADPLVSASWHPGVCQQVVDALRQVWQSGATEFHCRVENLRIHDNQRYRKTSKEDYHIWFTWGTGNGGKTLATLTLKGL